MKSFFDPLPVIFSFNGGVKYLPQNTIQAFRAGFDAGADAATLSVQLSSDSEVMVIHETKLDLISNLTGKVSSYSALELKNADAGYYFSEDGKSYPCRGKGFTFVTLQELLKEFSDKKFNIILLNNEKKLVKRYAEIITGLNAENRIMTASLYGSNIKLARRLMPGSATAFSMMGIIGVYALFKSGLIYFSGGFTADALQTTEAIGVSYIANSGLIRALHKRGIWIQVWDVKDEVQLKRLMEAGVDSFMTEDVPGFRRMMDRR